MRRSGAARHYVPTLDGIPIAPGSLAAAARIVRLRREREAIGGASGLRSFVSRVDKRYQWYRHCEVLERVLERVVAGELRRVMVFAPPRHGKSLLVSRLFPAYYLSRFPDRWIGLASYAAELAYAHSRAARDYYVLGNRQPRSDAAAVKHWETGSGGGLWATGVGGPATGKGFHVGIIDDPLKNAEEAASEVIREKQWDWLRSVFYTREEPQGAVIMIMTRWNEDDVAGRAIAAEAAEEDREGWHIVHLPAIADAEAVGYLGCTTEPDWRDEGAPLCPERYPTEKLRKLERRLGPYYWAALYQQRPGPREGTFFKWKWFEVVDAIPAKVRRRLRYWDTAGTEGAGDYTSGCRMSEAEDGIFYIEDVRRGQWSPGRRDAEIVATAQKDKELDPRAPIWLEQEAGVGGKERTQATVKALKGFVVHAEPVTGEKAFRAEPLAAQAEVGNVRIVRGDWNYNFLSEACAFPYAKNDDQVDSASGAMNKILLEPPREAGSFGLGV